MKGIMKYNLFKIGSTVLTLGVPTGTLALCSQFYKDIGSASTAAGAVFMGFIALFFLKDKIAENFKCPSGLVLAITTLAVALIIHLILVPIVYVCIASIVSCGIDELSFKRLYKKLEKTFPATCKEKKKFGFYFTRSKTVGVM